MSDRRRARNIIIDDESSRSVTVHIPSRDPDALEEVVEHGSAPRLNLQGQLFLPEGEPTNRVGVVVVQGLGGVKPERELTYGHKIAKAGHVALVIDTFGSRGLAETSDNLKALQVASWALLADAFAGLRFLAKHPAVNRNAICVIGFSWGGMVAVLCAYEQIRTNYLKDDPLRFGGHVAYYGCSIPRLENPTTTGAPLLVMIGKRDENVSVERTREICSDLRRGGSEVELEVYDGYHQWDGKDRTKRHNSAALADLNMTIYEDNKVREEQWDLEVDDTLSKALMLLRDVDWQGYDMLRDPALHLKTDRRLFDFLAGVARRAQAEPGDISKVPLGRIGEPVPD